MYLTAHQCEMILHSPHFSTPLTESWTDYLYYRGKLHASVLTLRFNNSPNVAPWTETEVERVLEERLYSSFGSMAAVTVIVDYDVLLRDGRDSFYIWRSNSNRHHFDQTQEFQMIILPAAINKLSTTLCTDPRLILDQMFVHSNVNVDRLLAVVCSFMLLHPDGGDEL